MCPGFKISITAISVSTPIKWKWMEFHLRCWQHLKMTFKNSNMSFQEVSQLFPQNTQSAVFIETIFSVESSSSENSSQSGLWIIQRNREQCLWKDWLLLNFVFFLLCFVCFVIWVNWSFTWLGVEQNSHYKLHVSSSFPAFSPSIYISPHSPSFPYLHHSLLSLLLSFHLSHPSHSSLIPPRVLSSSLPPSLQCCFHLFFINRYSLYQSGFCT